MAKKYIRQAFIFPSDFMRYDMYIGPKDGIPLKYNLVISGSPSIRRYKKKTKIKNVRVFELIDSTPINFQEITLNIPKAQPLLKSKFLEKFLELDDSFEETFAITALVVEEYNPIIKVKRVAKNFSSFLA